MDRVGPRLTLFVGWFVYAGVYLAFALATAAWHAWAFFLVYAVFYSLTEPAEKTLVPNLVGTERKGLAFGWYNFAIGIAALLSSLIFGVLTKSSGHWSRLAGERGWRWWPLSYWRVYEPVLLAR